MSNDSVYLDLVLVLLALAFACAFIYWLVRYIIYTCDKWIEERAAQASERQLEQRQESLPPPPPPQSSSARPRRTVYPQTTRK